MRRDDKAELIGLLIILSPLIILMLAIAVDIIVNGTESCP